MIDFVGCSMGMQVFVVGALVGIGERDSAIRYEGPGVGRLNCGRSSSSSRLRVGTFEFPPVTVDEWPAWLTVHSTYVSNFPSSTNQHAIVRSARSFLPTPAISSVALRGINKVLVLFVRLGT